MWDEPKEAEVESSDEVVKKCHHIRECPERLKLIFESVKYFRECLVD